ncbi:holo-ACP synthase [Actinomyces oricola]
MDTPTTEPPAAGEEHRRMGAGGQRRAPHLPQPPPVPGGGRAVGMDLVHVPSLAEQLKQPGTVFTDRAFTARERRDAAARAQQRGAGAQGAAEHLAARWAAKEAFVKAWSQALALRARECGTPAGPVIAPEDLDWRQIEVRSDRWGRPWLSLSGRVADAVTASLGPGSAASECWPASITHDEDWAAAIVLLRRPSCGHETQ